MRNILALIGLGFLVYQLNLLKYLSPLWNKIQKDSDIQQVEKVVKPITEKLGSDLGVTNTSPSPSATPTSSPTPKQYGAKLNITTPMGKLESGFGVTPETKKDLGVQDDQK